MVKYYPPPPSCIFMEEIQYFLPFLVSIDPVCSTYVNIGIRARTRGSRSDCAPPVHCLSHVTVSSTSAASTAWPAIVLYLMISAASVLTGSSRRLSAKDATLATAAAATVAVTGKERSSAAKLVQHMPQPVSHCSWLR